MKFQLIHNLTFLNILIPASATNPSQNYLLKKLYSEYDSGPRDKAMEFYEYFISDKCQFPIGILNKVGMVLPVLNSIPERYKTSPPTGYTEDLSSIDILFNMILYYDFFSKECFTTSFIVNLSKSAKELSNNCYLCDTLKRRYCDDKKDSGFMNILYDNIVNDFESLGADKAVVEGIKNGLDFVFKTLKAISIEFNKYIGPSNTKADENAIAMAGFGVASFAGIYTKIEGGVTAAYKYFRPDAKSKTTPTTDFLITREILEGLDRTKEYRTTIAPIIYELYCIQNILYLLKAKAGGFTSFSDYNPFFKTISNIDVLDGMATILCNLVDIIKNRKISNIMDIQSDAKTIFFNVPAISNLNLSQSQKEIIDFVIKEATKSTDRCSIKKIVNGNFSTSPLELCQIMEFLSKRFLMSTFNLSKSTDLNKIISSTSPISNMETTIADELQSVLQVFSDTKILLITFMIKTPADISSALKKIQLVIKEQQDIRSKTIYLIGFGAFLLAMDVLLLVIYTSAKSDEGE